ncbi:MAG: decaprenyl-phosphate phosphoribosyltransferase [Coriobacteriia bacterium]|nr:decaprenyl-phosphate phosphoribosyltransferase [Coriobacteriia bacterium]
MDFRDVIRLMRPRQWTKNLVVAAGLVFSGKLLDTALLGETAVAFVVFCLGTSALYALNDVLDADRDRAHPVKCDRPVASGRLGKPAALGVSAVLAIAAFALAFFVGPDFTAVFAAYVVLQLLYTFALKSVSIVDMLVIATGFVLRAVAGAVAIEVPVSPWLVLCTGLLMLFLAAAKRRHEIVLLRERSVAHRPVLSEYSAELLDSFMVTLSAATITSYALYTFFEELAPDYLLMLTIPFVIYGVLRYQYLVLSKDGGGRPEEILLSDGPIIIDVALWVTASVAVLYIAPRFLS